LAPLESDDPLLAEEEESIASRYELAVDEENEDWEMKLVLEMLRDGEAFDRHGKGRPQKIHLSVSDDFTKSTSFPLHPILSHSLLNSLAL